MKRPFLASLLLAACGAPKPASPPPASASRASAPPPPPADGPLAPGPAVLDRDFLRAYAETRRFTRGTPTAPAITPDGQAALFLRSPPRDPRQSLFTTDLATGVTRELLAPDALLAGPEHLTPEERARRERMRVTASGFTSFELSKDGAIVVLVLSGRLFVLERATGKTRELPIQGAAVDPRLSPDGKSVAFVADDDLHVVPLDGGPARAVTTGGTEIVPHGLADFAAAEELGRSRGFWWSPDSHALLVEQADASHVERLTIADPAHPELPPQRPAYPRAGKTNATLRFAVVPAAGGAPRWIDWDRERFPYVAAVTWDAGGPPTLTVLDRMQKTSRLLAVEPATGKTRVLVEEKDEAWVNADPTVPRWLPDGSGFLWSSEREGAWRLELRKADGALVRALTPVDAGYRGLAHLDTTGRAALVNAAADAVHGVVLRVPLGGGPITTVAEAQDGDVTALERGTDERLLLREASLKAMPRVVVRGVDGKASRELPSVGEEPRAPDATVEQVGPDRVRVAVIRPRSFVPGARYPVVDAAYAGPHVQVAQADARAHLLAQWLADATAAIVVAIDARGTPGRGRAWERPLAGKLGSVPIEGHVEALRALAAAHPEMDVTRVGAIGGSFGGYFSAGAVLRHPEVYAAGVAIAPVADWRDYDTCYTERYLGLPSENAAAYDEASLLTWAAKPGPASPPALAILHGTADDNVYFLHSLKLADALARAGRPFSFVPALGQTHQFASPELTYVVYARGAEVLREALRR